MVEGGHDLAPFATFVISNAGYGEGSAITRERFESAVETMVTEGVDVIVLALGYHYDEGLGDGVAREELNAIHDSVDYAANGDLCRVEIPHYSHFSQWLVPHMAA